MERDIEKRYFELVILWTITYFCNVLNSTQIACCLKKMKWHEVEMNQKAFSVWTNKYYV